MERFEKDQEEVREHEQLPPLTLVHFDDEDEAFQYEEQKSVEQKEEETNSENIIDKQLKPLYIPFWEQLLSESITAFENISGVIIPQKEKEEIWAKKDKIIMYKVGAMSYPVLDIKKLLEEYAPNVAKSDFLPQTIERSESLIKRLTRKIEDNNIPERRISPIMNCSSHKKELFWSYESWLLSEEEKEDQINLQCLEIERWHLHCLEHFHDQLLTQQIQEQIRKHKDCFEGLIESPELEKKHIDKPECNELDQPKLPFKKSSDYQKVKKSLLLDKSFSDYLSEEGKELLPFLVSIMDYKKPRYMAALLFALHDLKLFLIHPTKNTTDVYYALTNTFGEFGERQSLGHACTRLNSASGKEESSIKKLKNIINQELDRLKK